MSGPIGPTCQVVPDIPSFSVDDGFRYRIPDGMAVQVGSRVRVRVGGRRRRGHVTHVFGDEEPSNRDLVGLDGVVGTVPSFGIEDLPWLRWCAAHYVAPLSVILGRTDPPNVPRSSADPVPRGPGGGFTIGAFIPGDDPHAVLTERVTAVTSAGGSVLVVAPTVEEVERIRDHLARDGGTVEMAHSGLAAREATSSWVTAATRPGTILVGTREVALWPVAALAGIVVIEDARRVMRSPSTPTIGVREVALRRARTARIPVDFIAPVPSLEVLATGARVVGPAGREWPLVEVADRSEEPPSSSVLLERTRQAIIGAARRGPVFVLVPRRGYAAAFRCATCGWLRRCSSCGAAVSGRDACDRCRTPMGACPECGGRSWRALGAGIGVVVDDLARSLGDRVGGPDVDATVTVGTERDLVGRSGTALSVAVDVDGAAFAPNYRAAEDALRLFVRLARTVARKRGHRALVQTSDPSQRLVTTLVRGRSDGYLEAEAEVRKRSGFPPYGDLVALEVQYDDPEHELPDLARELEAVATVLGPALAGDRWRWLLTGRDLDEAKVRLRALVSRLRATGARVRVDVDAIDL